MTRYEQQGRMPPRDLGRLALIAVVLVVAAWGLLLSGCTTIGSIQSDANARCQQVGWESAECAYAQNYSQSIVNRSQAASAAAIVGGAALMNQRPYVPYPRRW